MGAVTFPAWEGQRYVGLAEVLVVLGAPILDLVWQVQAHDVAPEPGAEELERLQATERVHALVLLRHAAPNTQIVDGEVTGYAHEHAVEPVICIRAVDSTSWDVGSSREDLIRPLLRRFPEAMKIANWLDRPKDDCRPRES